MAIESFIERESIVFYQEFGDGNPGEPAIVITQYDTSISIEQEGREVLISSHEFDAFCKRMNRINLERKGK